MKKREYLPLLLIVLILAFSGQMKAQNWERIYPVSAGAAEAGSILPTDDGGFLMNGVVSLPNQPNHSVSFLKVDNQGLREYFDYSACLSRMQLAPNNYTSSIRTQDGNVLAAITERTATFPDSQYFELTTQAGAQLWCKNFQFQDFLLYDFDQANDGGLFLGGFDPNGVSILKTDLDGNVAWSKTYDGYVNALKMRTLADGSLIVAAAVDGGALQGTFVVKLDEFGNEEWLAHMSDFIFDLTKPVALTNGSVYWGGAHFLAGQRTRLDIFKLDKNGQFADTFNLMDVNSWVANKRLFDLDKTPDDKLVIGLSDIYPNAPVFTNYPYRFDLIKTDSLFNTEWQKGFERGSIPAMGNWPFDYLNANDLVVLGDEGFVVSGTFTNFDSYNFFIYKLDTLGQGYTNIVTGKLALDNDSNCTLDAGEPDWTVGATLLLTNGVDSFYTISDFQGNFSFTCDTGDFVLKAYLNHTAWKFCQDSFSFNIPAHNQTVHFDFPVQAENPCPGMEVDITTPLLRRCAHQDYVVRYCNFGSVTATDAYMEVTLDGRLRVDGASIPWSSVNGNVYTFQLGSVNIFECNSFTIHTFLPCDSAQLGQTLCAEAHIFPDSLCGLTNNLWDGSNLKVRGSCEGDSVRFFVKNEGQALQQLVPFIIIEDDMVMRVGQIPPLAPDAAQEIAVPARGSTYRFEVSQSTGHPWSQKPAVSVEACGTNAIGTFSTGFVTMFPPDDGADFIDVDCREVRGSYDPNDKEAYPKGVCNSHFVNKNTDLEYMIRFQNVGNDTAFRVVILDTLSSLLDPTSIQPGASSHPYQFEIFGNAVLKISFPGILLPDSTTNEPASQGFVKFRISQKPDNPVDAQIKNSAAIYFDFNAPVITNEVFHIIGEDFLAQQPGNFVISGRVTRDDGLPIDSAKVFLSDNCFTYTNATGDYIFTALEGGKDYRIQVEKDDDHLRGLTHLDLLELRDFMLRDSFQLGSPYRNFAADVDNSGAATTFDLVEIVKLLDGIASKFSNVDFPWQFFVERNFGLDPASSDDDTLLWQNPIMDFSEDCLNKNFIAVKKGDVVYENNLPQYDLGHQLSIPNLTVCGDYISVPVYVENAATDSVGAIVAGVNFDPKLLQYYAVTDGNSPLPPLRSAAQVGANLGSIRFYFAGRDHFKFEQGRATVAYLHFTRRGIVGDSSFVSIDTLRNPPYIFTPNKGVLKTQLVSGEIKIGDTPGFTASNDRTYDFSCDSTVVQNCLILENAIQPVNFLWNTGDTTACIILGNSGIVSCIITDATGCRLFFTDTILVIQPAPLTLDSVQVGKASNANISDGFIQIETVTGGTPPYNFAWSNGAVNPTIFNLSPGVYTLTLTDANGCELIRIFTVEILTGTNSTGLETWFADISPNPSGKHDAPALTITMGEGHIFKIEIFDRAGQLLRTMQLKTNTKMQLPEEFPSGVYLIILSDEFGAARYLKWVKI